MSLKFYWFTSSYRTRPSLTRRFTWIQSFGNPGVEHGDNLDCRHAAIRRQVGLILRDLSLEKGVPLMNFGY